MSKLLLHLLLTHYFHPTLLGLIRAQIRTFSLWKLRGLCYLLKELPLVQTVMMGAYR